MEKGMKLFAKQCCNLPLLFNTAHAACLGLCAAALNRQHDFTPPSSPSQYLCCLPGVCDGATIAWQVITRGYVVYQTPPPLKDKHLFKEHTFYKCHRP